MYTTPRLLYCARIRLNLTFLEVIPVVEVAAGEFESIAEPEGDVVVEVGIESDASAVDEAGEDPGESSPITSTLRAFDLDDVDDSVGGLGRLPGPAGGLGVAPTVTVAVTVAAGALGGVGGVAP